MSVELRPLGVACNIACQYCYQHPQRDAGNVRKHYDMDTMKAAILKEGGPFTLFGGEPLLMPIEDLEEILSWGFAQFGRTALQTNGTLITERHLALFKKYKVSVGVSADGPDELNDVRWSGSWQKTRENTQRTLDSIRRLVAYGIIPGIIITLHKGNALPARLPKMEAWIRELDTLGIRSTRLHLLETDHPLVGQHYRLSSEENIHAMRFFLRLQGELKQLRFDVFKEIDRLLAADDHATSCVWNACDPYTTSAVRGVEGDGKRTNCGRTNKDGVDFVKSALPSYVRYIALYHTPQEAGGCEGCRFFVMCKGQCPGTSIEGDWRNRTEHCEVWKALFAERESASVAQGRVPLSRHSGLPEIESRMLSGWIEGKNLSIQTILRRKKEEQQAQLVAGHAQDATC